MAGNLKEITADSQFQPELTNAGGKLVVVDFYAVWCGPCRNIAPVVQQYAAKYPKALFLKVDVDKCPETRDTYSITAMPTFVFIRNKVKVDSLRGANPVELEEKIKKWYGEDEDEDIPIKGHIDLVSLINKAGCECLNEEDDHPLSHALTSKGGYLRSDCDEQLIIFISFNQAVKLHSLKIHGPPDSGPKSVKVFINTTSTLDFDSAENMTPVQQLDLTPEDIDKGNIIQLRYVKYQNVQSVMLFVKDNQTDQDQTQIDYLAFIGSPVSTTNMSEFKRVVGKKGESH